MCLLSALTVSRTFNVYSFEGLQEINSALLYSGQLGCYYLCCQAAVTISAILKILPPQSKNSSLQTGSSFTGSLLSIQCSSPFRNPIMLARSAWTLLGL